MKIIFELKLPEDICDYIQQLNYEKDGLTVLLSQVMRTGKPNNEIFENFLEKYKLLNTTLALAMDEIRDMYIPASLIKEYPMCIFKVDVYKKAVIVYEKRDSCDK